MLLVLGWSSLMQRSNLMIVHTYREGNRCAGALANFACDMKLEFMRL